MAHVKFINHLRLDTDLAQETVLKLCRDLQIHKRVKFIFKDTWTDLMEDTGDVVVGTEIKETIWDGGTARTRGGGIVPIRLPSTAVFPLVWQIKGAWFGQSVSRVITFNNPMEMFLYLAAEEIRYLWQLEHPRKLKRIGQLLEFDPKADAAIYALRVLKNYRQKPGDFIGLKPSFRLDQVPD